MGMLNSQKFHQISKYFIKMLKYLVKMLKCLVKTRNEFQKPEKKDGGAHEFLKTGNGYVEFPKISSNFEIFHQNVEKFGENTKIFGKNTKKFEIFHQKPEIFHQKPLFLALIAIC